MNIDFNLWSWLRNMTKYGDFFLQLDIVDKYGIVNVKPLSVYEVNRLEEHDPENPKLVQFEVEEIGTKNSTPSELLENYEGSYPFALAAYNAGPKRVKYWKKINGNPQKGKIDYVDWIELVKFGETRNYIQRVLENVNVYRYMLKGAPIKIFNFFEDKPHY